MKSESEIRTLLDTLKQLVRERRKRQYDFDAALLYNTVQALEWVLNNREAIFVRAKDIK